MTGIKVDYINKKITLTKAFVRAMDNTNSDEFKIYCEITRRFPKFEVLGRTHRSPSKPNKNKRLTYKNMERYIGVYDNADALLKDFNTVRELSKSQTSCYHYVRDWFVKQFPNYDKLPIRENGKLFVEPILSHAV